MTIDAFKKNVLLIWSGLVNLLAHLLIPCFFPTCIKEAHILVSNAYDSWILVFMINSLGNNRMEIMFKTGQPCQTQMCNSSHNVSSLSAIRQTCCISFTLLILSSLPAGWQSDEAIMHSLGHQFHEFVSQLASLNILKILKDAIASSLGLCEPPWKPGTSPVLLIRRELCGL